VAHSQAAVRAAVTLDLNDVHDSIEVIGNLFSRYSTLFSAAVWAFLVPVIQHDWEAVFQVPWLFPTRPRRRKPLDPHHPQVPRRRQQSGHAQTVSDASFVGLLASSGTPRHTASRSDTTNGVTCSAHPSRVSEGRAPAMALAEHPQRRRGSA